MSLTEQIPAQYAVRMDAKFEATDGRRYYVERPAIHSYAMVDWSGRMVPIFKFNIMGLTESVGAVEIYSPNYREDALTDVLLAWLNRDKPMEHGVTRLDLYLGGKAA